MTPERRPSRSLEPKLSTGNSETSPLPESAIIHTYCGMIGCLLTDPHTRDDHFSETPLLHASPASDGDACDHEWTVWEDLGDGRKYRFCNRMWCSGQQWQEPEDLAAWRKGAMAYAEGVPRHRNPYPAEFASAESRLSWSEGYAASELAHNSREDAP